MYWLDEVKTKLKKGNKILFGKDSTLLFELNNLLELQSHKTVVLWALHLATETIKELSTKYPHYTQPKEALAYAKLWASGQIKMREAQRKILDCHAMAKLLTDKADVALCHAVGQACAVVHTAKHALGLSMYQLTAIVYRYGIDNCVDLIGKRNNKYIQLLSHYADSKIDNNYKWADFFAE